MQNNKEEDKDESKAGDELSTNEKEGTYDKAGSEDSGSLPNDPAENAKKTSPEEDAGKKEDTKLTANGR